MYIGFATTIIIMMGVVVGHIIRVERKLESKNYRDDGFSIIPSAMIVLILSMMLIILTIWRG